MESPDTPWARSHDGRVAERFDKPPGSAALFFHRFLASKGIRSGMMVDIGCGNGRNAVFFARNGFEVHAIDKSEEIIKDLDLHGVMPHCHSVTEYWLFEDSFFDLAMDILCYSCQNEGAKERLRGEVKRVLKREGYLLLCVPAGFSLESVAAEFDGFAVVAHEAGEDVIDGKKEKTHSLILKRL